MSIGLWKFGLLFGLMEFCLSGSIRPAPLKQRLCNADYVFKFRVVSGPKKDCPEVHISSPPPTTEKSTDRTSHVYTNKTNNLKPTWTPRPSANVPTVTPGSSFLSSAAGFHSRSTYNNSSITQPAINLTTRFEADSTNQVNFPVISSPSSSPRMQTTVPATPNRSKRGRRSLDCSFWIPDYQEIQIIKQNIYKGSEDLKLMDVVQVIDGKHNYKSQVILDLNFSEKLKLNGNYLFVGRRIPNGKLKDHVFISNPHTTEPWNKARGQLKDFDFEKDCKS